MRLIDADVLLDTVKNKYSDIVAGGYPYNVVAHDLVKLIESQPTAYDIDNVVEQMEAELYKGMESLDPVLISFNFGINKAIEIVKSGGAKWVD